jgi:Ca2+-transporting ATPase
MPRIEADGSLNKLDPFIISGSKVLERVGTYLVTGVGPHSCYGKLMMTSMDGTEATPLQVKLPAVAEHIPRLGYTEN